MEPSSFAPVRLLPVGVLVACTVLAACGSRSASTYSPEHSGRSMGTDVAPASADEEEVLALIDRLETGRSTDVGSLVVTADVPYHAASGRTCRTLSIKRKGASGSRTQLACQDGSRWFYAPSVTEPAERP